MAEYKASIEIAAKDRFSATAQKIAGVSGKLSARLEQGQRALGELGKKGGALKRLEALSAGLGGTGAAMDKARRRTAELGRSISQTAKPTRKLQREFDKSRKLSDSLKRKHREQKDELNRLRRELRGAGVDTRRLGEEQGKVARAIQRTTEKMEGLARTGDAVGRAKERYDRSLRTAASAALVGDAVGRFGRGALRMVARPLERMRAVERSAGEVATLGVSPKGIGTLKRRARQMAREVAGVSTAAFLAASYDLQSGISGLTEQGLADMTAQATLTARATKSEIGEITDLFATAYGVFKGSLHRDLSDSEFTGMFSSMLAKSVQLFKTTGPKMKQAIESMGDGLAASGVALSEQMALLGLLQAKQQSGVAGTTVQAIERTAAQAQEKFSKKGIDFKVLDELGNLRSLPDLLEGAQQAFGKQYTTRTGFQIQQAFGSEEAVKFFKALWGQQDAFRKATQAIKEAGEGGDRFARHMARLRDQNMDGTLSKLEQRWRLLEEVVGDALVPAIDRALPWLDRIVGWFEWFTEKMPGTTSVLVALIGGFGLIATVAAPVITAVTGLAVAVHLLGYRAKKAAAGMTLGGRGGSLFTRGIGSGAKGYGGFVGKLAKPGLWGKVGRKLPYVGAGLGVLSVGSTLLDSELTAKDKGKGVARTGAAVGGAWGGAKLGALGGGALGSIVPGIGTVIGAAVGGIAGSIAGYFGGDWIANLALGPIGEGVKLAEDPSAALESRLQSVENLLPSSDAREGPLSRLTAAGRSILETVGQGVRQVGAAPLRRPLAQALGTAAAGLAFSLPFSLAVPADTTGVGSPPQATESRPVEVAARVSDDGGLARSIRQAGAAAASGIAPAVPADTTGVGSPPQATESRPVEVAARVSDDGGLARSIRQAGAAAASGIAPAVPADTTGVGSPSQATESRPVEVAARVSDDGGLARSIRQAGAAAASGIAPAVPADTTGVGSPPQATESRPVEVAARVSDDGGLARSIRQAGAAAASGIAPAVPADTTGVGSPSQATESRPVEVAARVSDDGGLARSIRQAGAAAASGIAPAVPADTTGVGSPSQATESRPVEVAARVSDDGGLARSIRQAGAAAASGIAPAVPADTTGVGSPPQAGVQRPPTVVPAVQILPAAGQEPTREVRHNSTVIRHNYVHNRITISQQPGEDPQALADRIIREIEQRQNQSRREELYDEVGD